MNEINVIYWFNGILCVCIWSVLMAIAILFGEKEMNKGCRKVELRTPDPLICGKKIRTSEGKVRWYCDECLQTKKGNQGAIICVRCGEITKFKDAIGSYKYPICADCFLGKYKGDYVKYFKELEKRGLL